jgi:hypothetical protein
LKSKYFVRSTAMSPEPISGPAMWPLWSRTSC